MTRIERAALAELALKLAWQAGDEIIIDKTLYGCTFAFMTHGLPRFGVKVTLVDMTEPENLSEVQGLANVTGATLATSRNVVHAGWLPHQIQVGISGRSIAPKFYLAVGIRGGFNHTVGIQKAGVILALNQNRRAGQELRAAILQAGQTRIRPIAMTSATTMLALLPLAAGAGA